MRLKLVTPDRAPFWLIGNPTLNERTEQSEVLTEQLQITRQQQVLPGAEFDSPLMFDRQNQKVTYVATVRWEFTDEWARMDFIAELAPADQALSLHAWEGDVYLRVDKEGDYRQWLCEGAIISLAGTEIIGTVGLKLTYAVTFGGIGEARTGGVRLLRVRTDSTTALLSLTSAEIAAAGASVSLTDGDWMRVILLFPDGRGFEETYYFNTSYYPLPFPIDDTTLGFFQSYCVSGLAFGAFGAGCVRVETGFDMDPNRLIITTLGVSGPACYASLSLGRGVTPLYVWDDTGSYEYSLLNLLPDNANLTLNLAL